ncbi:tyrosine-type recombinase/integrase [Pseudomonas gingeri]|uniref:Tyrosine-type recombinase/integrase n=1 Tax=Pseudomonas gingeri TaxID=117681 RepID=A0A7Y7XB74_9PSED|nr:tyrosine-type recombinase/integrase [Pseudomonas gingeri]NWB96674.1 tyrosine-type recombinase/integrase [Pseudomonas gingeri]
MAREPMDMPTGVEIFRNSIRIRFTWNGDRRSETLPYPTTQKGIKAASQLRDQVVGLIRLGVLDDEKYSELFPGSSAFEGGMPTFGEYAQLWLDGRVIEEGTRLNYKGALNLYWMPYLVKTRLNMITTMTLRRIVGGIEWHSPDVRRNALVRLGTILGDAVKEGLIAKSPAELIDVPKRKKKDPDPLTLDEANQIVAHLYGGDHWPSLIYAAFFEFAFFTGMRLQEVAALRWDSVDLEKKQAEVCRALAQKQIKERTKTKKDRHVLLNDRAMHALEYAKAYAERRASGSGSLKEFPYVFPPSKSSDHIKQTSDMHHQWGPALRELKIRYRPPYNCRHTYATICIMSGMNPAFISQQLGHSVQMLLSTYARWINSSSDWSELEKLKIGIKSVSAESKPS